MKFEVSRASLIRKMSPTSVFPRRPFNPTRQVVVFVSLGFVVVFNLYHLRFLKQGLRFLANYSNFYGDLHASGESRYIPPSATWKQHSEFKNDCVHSTFVAGAVPEVSPNLVSRKSFDEDGFPWAEEDSSFLKHRLKVPMPPRMQTEPQGLEIDFVYKWVDGTQPKHRNMQLYWEKRLEREYTTGLNGMKCPAIDRQQNSVRQERDNNELLFTFSWWWRDLT